MASKSPTQNYEFMERKVSLWALGSSSARRGDQAHQGQQILNYIVRRPALSTTPGKDSPSTGAITTVQWAGVGT